MREQWSGPIIINDLHLRNILCTQNAFKYIYIMFAPLENYKAPILLMKKLTQALFVQGHRDNKCQNKY